MFEVHFHVFFFSHFIADTDLTTYLSLWTVLINCCAVNLKNLKNSIYNRKVKDILRRFFFYQIQAQQKIVIYIVISVSRLDCMLRRFSIDRHTIIKSGKNAFNRCFIAGHVLQHICCSNVCIERIKWTVSLVVIFHLCFDWMWCWSVEITTESAIHISKSSNTEPKRNHTIFHEQC